MSTASSSTSTLADTTEHPEAEPLPKKVGEIGYVPPRSPKSPEMTQVSQSNEPVLPARHPADRQDDDQATTTDAAEAHTTAPVTASVPATNNANSTSSSASSVKKSWHQRLSVGGISFFSLLRVVLLLIFLGATAAAWAITVRLFSASNIMSSSSSTTNTNDDGDGFGGSDSDDSDNGSSSGPSNFSSLVIVQVSFTVVVLVELLFLERSIFHARAERYMYKNGMSRGGGPSSANMGIAPWNRPSLPTYAAALAESGRGTGDVEDHLIAIPPPPAYGNTRGSVLLLSGHLRDSLVRNLNRSSQQSTNSQDVRPATPREMEEGRASRPISYDASEEVDNAKRAFELEAALSRLESRNHDGAHHP